MKEVIEEIYNNSSDIKYGWKDKKGDFHEHIDNEYIKNYSFQSPEELIKSRTGVCWETVELTRYELNQRNIESKSYFFVIPYINFYSHSIIVCTDNKKFYWIENSFKEKKGINIYDSLEGLIFDVIENFYRITCIKNAKLEDMKIYEYKSPKDSIGCVKFYFHCFGSKNITKKYLPKYLKLLNNNHSDDIIKS